jgi:hypothetical protein
MIGIGIGIPFIRVSRGAAIDAQAQAHFDRVIADGGLVPSGLSGVNAFFTTIKTIYGTADITTAISVGLDAQVLGYKLGAGAGATAGQAAQKLYSCSGASGDVVQTTAASQPLLLTFDGTNKYMWLSGVTSNYCATPSSAANRVNEIDLKFNLTAIDYTIGTQNLGGMWRNASQRYYRWQIDSSGTMQLVLSWNGTDVGQTSTCSVTINVTDNTNTWLRVTRNASTGDVIFYKSSDALNTNPQNVNWTQLGTTQAGATTAIYSTSSVALFEFGSAIAGQGAITGKIYRGTLSSTIGGAPVVDFNPNQYNAATSQTQWTSSTGEIWTINTGTATTGYKGQLTYRTTVLTDGIDDTMSVTMSDSLISTFNNNNNGVNLVAKRYINTNNQFIATFGGDYTANNSAQTWLPGGGTFISASRSGSVFSGSTTTATYTIPNYFAYSENIIYGGTTSQRINSTTDTSTLINGTTNKPIIVSGNMVLFNSGFGRLNGSLNTLIVTNDGTKFVEINDYMREINNI